jgi:hypothetical protein
MRLTTSELENKGYKEKDKFHYKDFSAFISVYIAKTNAATVFFLLINMLFFLALAVKVALVAAGKSHGLAYTLAFISGFVLFPLLIPVHEIIHAAAYKWCGAKRVSFNINIRKFIFLTVADKFVASKDDFFKVLFAPFVVITLLLGILFFAVGSYLQCCIITALVAHTFVCAGDFALASYFLFYKNEQLVTFDDADEQMVYFYKKAEPDLVAG